MPRRESAAAVSADWHIINTVVLCAKAMEYVGRSSSDTLQLNTMFSSVMCTHSSQGVKVKTASRTGVGLRMRGFLEAMLTGMNMLLNLILPIIYPGPGPSVSRDGKFTELLGEQLQQVFSRLQQSQPLIEISCGFPSNMDRAANNGPNMFRLESAKLGKPRGR